MSSSEARNMMGLLTSTLNKIKKDGKLDKFLSQVKPETKKFLFDNKIVNTPKLK
jgi:hypothetical protein